MLTIPAPAAVHGSQLEAELDKAGIKARVSLVADELVIDTDATKAAVVKVVNAHKPAPEVAAVQPLSDDEITQLRALLTSG